MRFERAARFGIYASVGFLVISMGAFELVGDIRTGVEGGTMAGDLAVLTVLAGATAAGMVFLFALIGEYVDRELDRRGLAGGEE